MDPINTTTNHDDRPIKDKKQHQKTQDHQQITTTPTDT